MKLPHTIAISVLLLSAALATPLAQPPGSPGQARVKAFTGARVIDGTDRPPMDNATIVVSDGKIVTVAPAARAQVPANAERVSLAGKTVMPGIVNAHGHVGNTVGMEQGHYSAENVQRDLKTYAAYGVTTVFSLGDDQAAGIRARDSQRTPSLDRARLFVAGPVLAPKDVDEARKLVDENVAMKVDIIKIRVDDNLGATPKMKPEIYKAIIDEAHRKNLRVIAHIFYLADAKDLVKSGVDGLMHSVRDKEVDDEFLQLLRQHPGVFVTPNLGITSRAMDAGRPAWLDDPLLHETIPAGEIKRLEMQFANRRPEQLANTRASWDLQVRNLAKMRAAGARIVLGSDSAGDPGRTMGWHALWELDALAKAGMTPSEVIVASTRLAAETLRLDQLGMVMPGKSADFVVLNANPLENIANTRKIDRVYLRGEEVDRAALRRKFK